MLYSLTSGIETSCNTPQNFLAMHVSRHRLAIPKNCFMINYEGGLHLATSPIFPQVQQNPGSPDLSTRTKHIWALSEIGYG